MIYVGFWKRFAAVLIDGVILLIPSLILMHPLYGAGSILVGLAYKPVFEASPISATPGKALLGMVVLTEGGDRISLRTSLIRYLGSIVSGCLLLIGYLIQPFTPKRQTLHDFFAGTVVVERPAADVNYFRVWWAEMQAIFNGARAVSSDSAPRTYDATPAPRSTSVATAEIESLFKLYQAGALTEAEYQEKKAKILAQF